MIISPPFLPFPNADDEAFVRDAMPDSVDVAPGSGGAPLGSYPLTTAFTWHNGLHIDAPRDTQSQATQARQFLSVRAIADGTVVFRRDPKGANATLTDPQNYNPYSNTAAWTDNGIVIVRHTTDIGAAGNAPTSVTYYSVYMHLSHIETTVNENQSVWRKDNLGTAGRIYGRENQIHFEVCLNSSELQKLVGSNRATTWTDPATVPNADGRTDAVFGSLYVYLPAGTPTSAAAPLKHLSRSNLTGGVNAAAGQLMPNTLQAAQWVEIRYRNGSATVSSYRAVDGAGGLQIGDLIGTPYYEQDFEYNLYANAVERHANAVATGANNSSPSGWYELLRFGRNLGTDPLPAEASHWRAIPSGSGTVWADLNAPGTHKFSDADFPAFKGWQFFDDDPSPENQKCDSVQLKWAIRDTAVPESIRVPQALVRRLGDEKVRERLKRAVCKFPTEWDKSTIVQRYEWLKADQDFKITEGRAWDEFRAHAESISFNGLPQEYKDAVWHIHPRMFVSHMRLCGWLSEKEAVQLFPRTALRNAGTRGWVNEGVNPGMQIFKDSLTYLNKTTRKYCITTQRRMAAFYGNSMQETQWFGLLT